MSEVYILGGLRSYIGVENGIYKDVLPEDLAAEVLIKLIEKYEVKKETIDEIICGNVIGTGGNIARLIALKAGIPKEVPAFTVDLQCVSALKAVELAYLKIAAGDADIIIAGGAESASMRPVRIYNTKDTRGEFNEGVYTSAQFSPTEYGEDTVFRFGERVAERYNITEKELNDWSILSHQKAAEARQKNRLENILTPVKGSQKDEGIREGMNLRLLERLPKTIKNGRNSIGNVSLTNDGAAFLILCSPRFLKKFKVSCDNLLKIQKIKTLGIDPLYSPEGAMEACDKLLESAGLSYEEMDAFEFNEAFAAIDVIFERKHKDLMEKYNMFGGALAYGHPYGASGAVITLHLSEALKYKSGRYGIAAAAAAGGIGMAILIEREVDVRFHPLSCY